jgi:hypothetical protein
MLTETTADITSHPSGWLLLQKEKRNNKCWCRKIKEVSGGENIEKLELSCTVNRTIKCYGRWFGYSQNIDTRTNI